MSEIIIVSSDNEDNAGETIKSCSPTISELHKNKNGDKSLPCEQDLRTYSGFENFLKYCADVEVNKRGGSERSMNIIKEKILSRYKEADPDYQKSEAFVNIVISARKKIEKDPSRLFVHLKEVSDELNVRSTKKKSHKKKRKIIKSEDEPQSKHMKQETVLPEDSTSDNEVEINERHVKKLEHLFHKVYCKVKKLEQKEVDWDDEKEDNSNYIKWSRYSNRLYRIWEKWQEAKGCLNAVKRLKSKRIAFAGIVLAGTKYPKLNQVIENFVNKTQKFPDFHDILKLTTETLNQEKKVTSDELRTIAASAFKSLGNQLQKSRVFDFWNSVLTYLPPENENAPDPAEKDETLQKKLQENQKNNEEKINQVFEKFVDQQESQKLEPEEVPPDVDDENYKSAGEEGQEDSEEEDEQEDPEDIIAISSSSDENEKEGARNAEEKSSHYENGDAGESTDIDIEIEDAKKVTKEVDRVKEEKVDSVVEDSVLTGLKKEMKIEEIGSIASCSFVVSRNKKEDSDDDIVEISD